MIKKVFVQQLQVGEIVGEPCKHANNFPAFKPDIPAFF
jgi:hypothetical protein